MVSCNCFCCVVGPVVNDAVLKTSKAGNPYVQVSLSVNYYTGKKDNPYSNQLYQFALFGDDAKSFCDKGGRGDILSVIGIATAGKGFTTNKQEEVTPVELKNPSWKFITGKPEAKDNDTTEDEF